MNLASSKDTKWLFHFKEFSVHHALSSMKVGTDGVLLGIWADIENTSRILDIGTGCGLISLLLAQRNPTARIQAIDIEEQAVKESKRNFEESKWAERLTAEQISFQDFSKRETENFDLLVSNPPFFSNSLKSNNESRNMARHDDFLTLESLFFCSRRLLNEKGRLAIVLPSEIGLKAKMLACQQAFFLTKQTEVVAVEGEAPNRLLLEFSLIKRDLIANTLIIRTTDKKYSPQYLAYTQDYYLKLK